MKIAVYGSARGNISEDAREKARRVGRAIAENNAVLVTGGCPGLPYEAVLGANEAHGKCIAFSPAVNLKSHKQTGFPFEGFSEFVFVPGNYKHADNDLICRKYRNVASVSYADAAIIIGGRIGTMNEFTIAYDLGKSIGVLTGTGGITNNAIKILLQESDKQTGSVVIFDADPQKLVQLIINKCRH